MQASPEVQRALATIRAVLEDLAPEAPLTVDQPSTSEVEEARRALNVLSKKPPSVVWDHQPMKTTRPFRTTPVRSSATTISSVGRTPFKPRVAASTSGNSNATAATTAKGSDGVRMSTSVSSKQLS